MKKWWNNLSLQSKLQIPMQLILLLLMLLLQDRFQEMFTERVIADAREKALVSADGVLNGLNMLMIGGIISDPDMRTLYVKKMGSSERVQELRVIRNTPVQQQFGPGLPSEQAKDEMDRAALSSAQVQTRLQHRDGNPSLRVVVPFIARKEFRGTNCLNCHQVQEGAVNGAASITFDLAEEFSMIRKTKYAVWGALALIQVILFFILGWLFKKVISPAHRLQQDLEKLGAGDFTGDIHVHGNDEIGQIAGTVSRVNDELGNLIGDVKGSAINLAATAQRVAMVSSMTSQGVAAQKDETKEASEAVNSIASSLSESVASSRNAVSVADTISAQARTVQDVVAQTISNIHGLSSEVRNAAEVIRTLEKESNDISGITQLITEITSQTNLLALNAAIEAARAGEQGRGFAVVADEVRKLAQRTQDATQEIHKAVASLQSGARNAVKVMGESCDKAVSTATQVDQTNASLQQIIQSIAEIHDVNERIAASVDEQSSIATRINSTIINISHVAEQTAFSSKNTSAEIEKVAEAAAHLSQLVERFTVEQGGSAPAPVAPPTLPAKTPAETKAAASAPVPAAPAAAPSSGGNDLDDILF